MLTSEQELQHALHTLLITIFGMLTFLKGRPLTAEQQVYLEYISKSANALLDGVNYLSFNSQKRSFFESLKLQVLLVEDHPNIKWIHQKMLVELGCKVELASNARETLEFANKHYDLIFLDIGLPDLNEIRLAIELRCFKNSLIAITAHVDRETKEKCLTVGIEQVIHKPVGLKTIAFLLKPYDIKQIEAKEMMQ